MPSSRLLLSALLAALASTACSKEPAANAATSATGANAVGAATGEADAAASVDAPAAPAPVRTVTGTVVETMNAASYTYVRVDTGTEKIWAATSQMEVAVGDRLVVPLEMSMRNFHSDTLDRDFPLLYFSSSVSREGEAPAGQPATAGQATPPGHPPVGGAAKVPVTVTEVIPPPPGGRSVADLWAQRASLAGQTVVVRGKVVKFLGGIMGRNWVHLQDGTGSAKDGTNDITVTTDADVKAGDIVTATGTLAVDKDFGSGYRYGALIEGATIGR